MELPGKPWNGGVAFGAKSEEKDEAPWRGTVRGGGGALDPERYWGGY